MSVDSDKQDLFRAIDAEQDVDPDDKAASKVLYNALQEGRDGLGAVVTSQLMIKKLSRQVRDAAAKRSAEILVADRTGFRAKVTAQLAARRSLDGYGCCGLWPWPARR